MNGTLKTLSVKQKILNATHGTVFGRPEWELAQFLLLHYDEIDGLKTSDVAERCHVSPSTVRRFCQGLGYDNFSDLRRAKQENPENQYRIAEANESEGNYRPRRMYDEIARGLWTTAQKTPAAALERLAAEMTSADAVLIYSLRPYSFVLEEFQSQLAAFGKHLYLFDEISDKRALIGRFGKRLCHISVSLAGVLFPAIDADIAALAGYKAAVYSPKTIEEVGAAACLDRYDALFPFHLRTQEYNYLEVFGKYAVMYFFDLLFGCFVRGYAKTRTQ